MIRIPNFIRVNIFANFEPSKQQKLSLSDDRWKIQKLPPFTKKQKAKIKVHRDKLMEGLNIQPHPILECKDTTSEEEMAEEN